MDSENFLNMLGDRLRIAWERTYSASPLQKRRETTILVVQGKGKSPGSITESASMNSVVSGNLSHAVISLSLNRILDGTGCLSRLQTQTLDGSGYYRETLFRGRRKEG